MKYYDMADNKNAKLSNINKIQKLVDYLPIRDERIFIEHDIYQKILNVLLEGIWIFDENFITTYVNSKCAELMECSVEQMIDKSFFDFIDSSQAEFVLKQIESKNKKVKKINLFNFMTFNGKNIEIEITNSPIIDEYGNHRGSVATLCELNNSHLSYINKDLLFDVSLDGLAIIDTNGIFREVNNSLAEEIIKCNKSELLGSSLIEIIHPDDLSNTLKSFKQLKKGRDMKSFKTSIIDSGDQKVGVVINTAYSQIHKIIFVTIKKK